MAERRIRPDWVGVRRSPDREGDTSREQPLDVPQAADRADDGASRGGSRRGRRSRAGGLGRFSGFGNRFLSRALPLLLLALLVGFVLLALSGLNGLLDHRGGREMRQIAYPAANSPSTVATGTSLHLWVAPDAGLAAAAVVAVQEGRDPAIGSPPPAVLVMTGSLQVVDDGATLDEVWRQGVLRLQSTDDGADPTNPAQAGLPVRNYSRFDAVAAGRAVADAVAVGLNVALDEVVVFDEEGLGGLIEVVDGVAYQTDAPLLRVDAGSGVPVLDAGRHDLDGETMALVSSLLGPDDHEAQLDRVAALWSGVAASAGDSASAGGSASAGDSADGLAAAVAPLAGAAVEVVPVAGPFGFADRRTYDLIDAEVAELISRRIPNPRGGSAHVRPAVRVLDATGSREDMAALQRRIVAAGGRVVGFGQLDSAPGNRVIRHTEVGREPAPGADDGTAEDTAEPTQTGTAGAAASVAEEVAFETTLAALLSVDPEVDRQTAEAVEQNNAVITSAFDYTVVLAVTQDGDR